MNEADERPKRVRLPVRRISVRGADDAWELGVSVHCPISATARSVTTCASCPRLVQADDAAVECEVEREGASVCGALLAAQVMCLDGELPAARALEVLEQAGVNVAPVVDDNGVWLGMVSTAGLFAALRGEGTEGLEVEDALQPGPLLSEQATLFEAIELMASSNVDQVPVIDSRGRLVGVLTALDLVRWLSREGS